MPIPALAPVDKLEGLLTCVMPLAADPLAPVRAAVLAAEPPEQTSVLLEVVHMAPLLQHPPPTDAGQLNWPEVQPVGATDAREVLESAVEMHRLVVAHIESTEQHPPP
jgi:hypothetical protein